MRHSTILDCREHVLLPFRASRRNYNLSGTNKGEKRCPTLASPPPSRRPKSSIWRSARPTRRSPPISAPAWSTTRSDDLCGRGYLRARFPMRYRAAQTLTIHPTNGRLSGDEFPHQDGLFRQFRDPSRPRGLPELAKCGGNIPRKVPRLRPEGDRKTREFGRIIARK